MRTQYLNKARRNMVFWVAGFNSLMERELANYKGKQAGWIKSIMISLGAFLDMELEERLGYEFDRFSPEDDEPIDYKLNGER